MEAESDAQNGPEVRAGAEGFAGVLRRALEDGVFEPLARTIDAYLEEPVFQRDDAFLEILLPLMERYASYFDAEVRGLEDLPREGGMLLVGNHSGGTIVPDTAAFIAAWYREMGLARPLVGLAFDAMFAIPGVRDLMRKIGQIPANPEDASGALAEGHAVFVYPGGAHEAFRPWTDRNRIDFANHKGFVRLALQAGVPVVPVVAHGGHDTTVVLTRGSRAAEMLGMTRLRVRVAPVLWQVPWGVSMPGLLGLPLPAKIVVQVCEPLDWSGLGPDAADDEAIVDRCYDEIIGRMQAQLDALVEEHPYPILSRMEAWVPESVSALLPWRSSKP